MGLTLNWDKTVGLTNHKEKEGKVVAGGKVVKVESKTLYLGNEINSVGSQIWKSQGK